MGVLRQALERGDVIVSSGLVLQALLQGFTAPETRASLIERFAALPLVSPQRLDHIDAAELRNRCRRQGVQWGRIDALLAQSCIRHGLVLLSTDRGFVHAARQCALGIWRAP